MLLLHVTNSLWLHYIQLHIYTRQCLNLLRLLCHVIQISEDAGSAEGILTNIQYKKNHKLCSVRTSSAPFYTLVNWYVNKLHSRADVTRFGRYSENTGRQNMPLNIFLYIFYYSLNIDFCPVQVLTRSVVWLLLMPSDITTLDKGFSDISRFLITVSTETR